MDDLEKFKTENRRWAWILLIGMVVSTIGVSASMWCAIDYMGEDQFFTSVAFLALAAFNGYNLKVGWKLYHKQVKLGRVTSWDEAARVLK